MRKLPMTLLAAGAFALAYAAGAYCCVLAARRRERASRVVPLEDGAADALLARYELAANWARQAMFGSSERR